MIARVWGLGGCVITFGLSHLACGEVTSATRTEGRGGSSGSVPAGADAGEDRAAGGNGDRIGAPMQGAFAGADAGSNSDTSDAGADDAAVSTAGGAGGESGTAGELAGQAGTISEPPCVLGADSALKCSVSLEVSGLNSKGLVLRNNQGDELSIPENGRFVFSAALPAGSPYHVSVASQPTPSIQTCSVLNADGVLDAQSATPVRVKCSPWTKVFGSDDSDAAYGITGDGLGNIYVVGFTNGALNGQENAGGSDGFLEKFSANGNLLWTRQLGSAGDDFAEAVATDARGNVYVAGYTLRGFDQSDADQGSTFIAKYDARGNRRWLRQQGAGFGYLFGLATDAAGNSYAVGYSEGDVDGNVGFGSRDVILVKCDTDGNKLWTRVLGTSGEDFGYAVALSANSNVLVTGFVGGSLDNPPRLGDGNAFLAAYSASGKPLWSRQFGNAKQDLARRVATDSQNHIYVTGSTGNLSGEGIGPFVMRWDSSGTLEWTQPGGGGEHGALAVDAEDHAYVTRPAPGDNILVRKLDALGKTVWDRQFGNGWGVLWSNAMALDQAGDLYIAGYTNGSLDNNSALGVSDAFIVKYDRDGTKQ